MKFLWVSLVAVSFLVPNASDAAGKKIQTLKGFKSAVVNRTLANNDGSLRIRSNGRVTGTLQGKKLTGAWNWQGKRFCRALKWGGQDMGSTCQTVVINGKNISFVRPNGRATSYVIK
ncbi:MAG: hypothetical protein AAF393_10035 [Pseudomonadota bacterium]